MAKKKPGKKKRTVRRPTLGTFKADSNGQKIADNSAKEAIEPGEENEEVQTEAGANDKEQLPSQSPRATYAANGQKYTSPKVLLRPIAVIVVVIAAMVAVKFIMDTFS